MGTNHGGVNFPRLTTVEHGAIPGLDLAALQARHQQAATALMARNR